MIVNIPAVLEEFTLVFESYETALTHNDVPALDGFFWQSPLALRFGTAENSYGSDAIARFRIARRGGSPPRDLSNTILTTFDRDFATANTEFRRLNEHRTGRQSQTWVRLHGRWCIVAAHISFMDIMR